MELLLCIQKVRMIMTNNIEKRLSEIEADNNVRILFAVESGSRAWGFPSPDSDWDVRFVYAHPLEWYLAVNMGKDVIEVVADDGFDASGWDVRKALQLFRKSNPTLLEWFASPIIYRDNEKLRDDLLSLLPYYFSRSRTIHHYYHIATNHQNRYLEKRGVELKRYLYFIRSLLACKWVIGKGTPPPVPFVELVNSEVEDANVRKELERIVELKREGRENDKKKVSDELWKYGLRIEAETRSLLDAPQQAEIECGNEDAALDKLLYDVITQAK